MSSLIVRSTGTSILFSAHKGLAELDAGKVLSHEQMLKNQARRKAAFVRSLAKAA
jgi:hypothetical protein